MTDVDDRVLDRVRKLLTRAEHPATPPAEAEACSAKAAALMSRHLIDRAMVDAGNERHEEPVVRRLLVEPPYAVGKVVLLTNVAAAFDLRLAVGGSRRSGPQLCTLVGFPGDVAMVELLFTSLLLQASTAMLRASQTSARPKAFRRAFLLGYAEEVGARLAAASDETDAGAESERPGTSLVLADRGARVDTLFAEQFPHLRSLRMTVSSGGGLVAGRAAGARANLDSGVGLGREDRRQIG